MGNTEQSEPRRHLQVEDLRPLSDIAEVADILNTSTKTIRRLVARRKLVPARLAEGGSSKLLFPKREVLRLVAELGAT